MSDPSPMAENDAWLKGYEAGVAEGRKQVKAEAIELARKWSNRMAPLRELEKIPGTPPGEPTTQQGTTGEGED